MKKLLALIALLASAVQAQEATPAQKTFARRVAETVKGLRPVYCPRVNGDPYGFIGGVCLRADASMTTAQLAVAMKKSFGKKSLYPEWPTLGRGEYLNGIDDTGLRYGVLIVNVGGTTYLRVARAELVPTPRPALTAQARCAFDTLVIRLTGEVVPCTDKPDPAKVCALTILSPELVKQWVSLSSDMKQVTPWTRTVGEMLEADFTVGGVPYTMFVSDLGSKGTLIQWVR